jgi:deoxyribose-phosphate aldolase
MTEHTTIRAQLARMIDNTLLKPEATDDDVARLALAAWVAVAAAFVARIRGARFR